MRIEPSPKTLTEPAREVRIWKEADVVVVGGGPGGVGAAVSAARSGAKTVLIERYGHLGGMATGGLVNIIPNMSDWSGRQHVFGISQEIIDRLDKRGATSYPKREDWGTTERRAVDYYLDANLGFFYIRNDPGIGRERVLYTAVVDPEVLKDELNDMVRESGAELLLHSWGTQPIMEGNKVNGVIFESKSGRQAVLGKVVIDSTGDGDIFVAAGAAYDSTLSPALRTSKLAIVFWLANVDIARADAFKKAQPGDTPSSWRKSKVMEGHPFYFKGILESQKNCVWFHFFQTHPDGVACDAMDVEELTMMDVRARKRALTTYEFFKKNSPVSRRASSCLLVRRSVSRVDGVLSESTRLPRRTWSRTRSSPTRSLSSPTTTMEKYRRSIRPSASPTAVWCRKRWTAFW